MDLLMEQSTRLGACSVSGSSAAAATSPTCAQLFPDTECLRIPILVRGHYRHNRHRTSQFRRSQFETPQTQRVSNPTGERWASRQAAPAALASSRLRRSLCPAQFLPPSPPPC
uniref:Uncharacterized protein n=1 Tax=Rangifer tarandus platyrhynchus TaxID=3082113 RepID=A0ACB0ER92_RANTA|nr:unnamed protein product [Rangifer tarandus platyrhynchus]